MKILVAHPGLRGGGSEAVAMSALEAFQHRFETSLLTLEEVDWRRLNSAYGTKVDPARIDLIPRRLPRLGNLSAALRGAYLNKFARQVGSHFDLCVSAYNFVDFGTKAIQLIADFSWHDEIRNRFDPPGHGLSAIMHRDGVLRRTYLRLASLVAGSKMPGGPVEGDIVVANSEWTAATLERTCGLKTEVLFPPVILPQLPSGVRRTGDFVSLGRISPEKRILESMDVLARVRNAGFDFRYHIIGPVGTDTHGSAVCKAAARHGGWVRLAGPLQGDEKIRELARHSFGIHMRQGEAFGIAVAEMGAAGLIPFVPAYSAPAEIVNCAEVTFDSPGNAVEAICRILSLSNSEQQQYRADIGTNCRRFGKARFQDELMKTIEGAAVSR